MMVMIVALVPHFFSRQPATRTLEITAVLCIALVSYLAFRLISLGELRDISQVDRVDTFLVSGAGVSV